MASEDMPKRIEFVYKDALDNISFTKKQEWIVAGYGLTIHAAVVAIWKQFHPSSCLQLALTVATLLATGYGIAVLKGYAQGLAKWRDRLNWIYSKYFDDVERRELKLGQRPKSTEQIFIGGLCLTFVASAIVTLLILWS